LRPQKAFFRDVGKTTEMDREPSRRRLLGTVGAAVAAAVAGCSGGDDAPEVTTTPPGSVTTTASTTTATDGGDGDGGDRPTVTERDPRSLDVNGAWTQVGSDPGHDGSADATAAPEAAEVYWQLRRVRSGPPVLLDGRLFHYAKVGEETGGRPTVTRTREPDAGTAHPVYGRPVLVARSANDGRIEWTAPVPAESSGWPAATGDRVVGAVRGEVAAHDAATGETLWTVDLEEQPPGTPVVVDGTAVVPVHGVVSGDEYVRRPAVRAFDVADGAEQWSVEPPHRANGVAVAGGTAVVISGQFADSGTLLGLSTADGVEQWRREVSGGFFDLPVVGDGAVYLADGGDGLRSLSTGDGNERWSVQFDGEPGTVAVDGGTVYAAVEGRVVALDATDGSRRWETTVADGSEFATAVAVGTDAVYAGFDGVDAGLYALGREDGSERWSHGFPDTVVEGDMIESGVDAQPVVAAGAVYVPAVDGLYAFGPP